MSKSKEKEYGLIIPSKKPKIGEPAAKKTNVFGDDSDDDQSTVDWVKQALKKQSQSSMQQKQSTLVMKKALVEDPTVYQYDELYDDMEKKRTEVKEKAKANRQAKYMPALLEAAERRNREHEQRIERQVQKEREDEKDMFDDKDVFVTGAYRKKMEEAQRIQEEQDKKDALDDLTDVTKQKDMSGFYRHLYRQTMEEEHNSVGNKDSIKETPAVSEPEVKETPREQPTSDDSPDRRAPSPKTDSNTKRESKDRELYQKSEKRRHRSHSRSPKERSYRDREDSRYSGRHRDRDVRRGYRSRSRSRDRHRRDRDREIGRDRHRRRTPESDRYRQRGNRSRSRSGERTRNRNRGSRYFSREQNERGHSPKRPTSENLPTDISPNKIQATPLPKDSKSEDVIADSNQNEDAVKSHIWVKRTIGTKLTDALARYFRRKQENPVIPSTITVT